MDVPAPRYPLSLAEAWRQPGSGLARASIALIVACMGAWLLLGLWALLWSSLFKAGVIDVFPQALSVMLLLEVVCGVLAICCGVLARRTILRAQRGSQPEATNEEQTESDMDPQARRITAILAAGNATSMPEEVAVLGVVLGGGLIVAAVVTGLVMANIISFEAFEVAFVAMLGGLLIWNVVRLRRH